MTNFIPVQVSREYTGHVEPSGEAQERIIHDHHGPTLSIIKLSVGPFDNNVYLVTCLKTHESLLVDAANEPERILDLINKTSSTLTTIVITHQHHDHWQALSQVAHATKAKVVTGEYDAAGIDYPMDELLADADSFLLGELVVEITHLRGHTLGSIALCITVDGITHIFSGDSLFPGGIGKTNSPKEFTMLLSDVENRLFDRYLDSAIVYPGHGNDTTLGKERPFLPLWRERGW